MAFFGISVYPDLRPMEEIKGYLHLAASCGAKKVFSSMFSMEGTNEAILNCFADFIATAHGEGLTVSLDVNHQFLTQLGAAPSELKLFAELGCDELRMDVPYGNDDDLKLIANPYGIQISFNASFGVQDHIQDLLDKGADRSRMVMCHNFYPQRYTGMKWENFQKTNAVIRRMGLRIGAFATSHTPGTHGVWDAKDGMCTVERMRDLPIDLQARMLLACGTEELIIGNAYASKEEMLALQEVLTPIQVDENAPIFRLMKNFGNQEHMEIPPYQILRLQPSEALCETEREILFDYFPHQDVGDSSEWIWRSRMPRYLYKDRAIPPRTHPGKTFSVGDVVMVNDNYKHYAGELQIVLLPIVNDATRNYVGHISPEELQLLPLLRAHEAIVFRGEPNVEMPPH